ncbi:MAG TPA: tetratricopeptide repeat protein [Magnetospirillaceae bacterium]|nr:tetratricopeptide repeat protein [Magnetospirillaceae bacterium]
MLRPPEAGFRAAAFLVLLALISAQYPGPGAQAPRPDALRLFREGKFEEARIQCLREIAEDPNNIEAYVVLGWTLVAMGRYADAEAYARRALEEVRRDPRIMETMGVAAFFLGKNDQALRWFQTYVTVLPEGSRVASSYQHMGEIYIRTSRWGHADIALRTALQFEPTNARWWTRLGYAREMGGDHRYALEAYEAALRINPRLTDAQLGRERVLRALR